MRSLGVRSSRRRTVLVVVMALVALLGAATPAGAADHAAIEGDGSTWVQGTVEQWIADVQSSSAGLQVAYSGVGSSYGRKAFANSQDDFAISEIPYQGVDPLTGQADTSSRPYTYVPIVAGGTSFSYHITVGGKLLTGIRLSGLTLAKIFTRQITMWNDPAIAADNTGLSLPALSIKPVARSDGSGTTAQFTKYLVAQYPAIWKAGTGLSTFTSNYPQLSGVTYANGSDQVMNTIASDAGNGTIGYVEYSYALNKNYPVVKVLNAAGYYVQPTQYNVAVALTKAQINQDTSSQDYLTQILTGVYTNTDPRAYPLSSYSYMIIPTSSADSRMTTAKRQTLVDFLSYSLCAGQNAAGAYGYAPLPLNLVQAAFTQVAALHDADPNVSLDSLNLARCGNPTFDGSNNLAQIAPQPAACDKQGATLCEMTGSGGDQVALVATVPTTGPGSLVLQVPTGANVLLTGARDTANAVHANAPLPTVTVTDTRASGSPGWQVDVQAEDFTAETTTIGARYLGLLQWQPKVEQPSGGRLLVGAGLSVVSALSDPTSPGLSAAAVLAESLVQGPGTTTLSGKLTLDAPDAVAGTYTSTLTLTLIGD